MRAPIPKIGLEYMRRKCGNAHPATASYAGMVEDLDLVENRSRHPFCGEGDCADLGSLEKAVRELQK